MVKPLTAELLREAAGRLGPRYGERLFMCFAYDDVGGCSADLLRLLVEAVGPTEKSWYALPMTEGTSCHDSSSLAWRFDLFNILAEYLDAEQSELATLSPGAKPRGRAGKAP